ncbi:MAG: helix-turn-helix transcriptional regulator [Cyanobacteria bacterium SIG32]|nr:helix-turn-helix transcriptional regulator [Cyanobacteria bacterium SIG32]
MNFKQTFAKKLREIRKQRHLTQEQLAELVSVDFRHISYIETAKSFPSTDLIERICKALNVTYSQLFDFELETSREDLILKTTNIIKTLDDEKLALIFKIASGL